MSLACTLITALQLPVLSAEAAEKQAKVSWRGRVSSPAPLQEVHVPRAGVAVLEFDRPLGKKGPVLSGGEGRFVLQRVGEREVSVHALGSAGPRDRAMLRVSLANGVTMAFLLSTPEETTIRLRVPSSGARPLSAWSPSAGKGEDFVDLLLSNASERIFERRENRSAAENGLLCITVTEIDHSAWGLSYVSAQVLNMSDGPIELPTPVVTTLDGETIPTLDLRAKLTSLPPRRWAHVVLAYVTPKDSRTPLKMSLRDSNDRSRELLLVALQP